MFKDDLRILYQLAFASKRGKSHAEKMENFYCGQANDYDRFREKLLRGRKELLLRLPWNALRGGSWIDLGAGTGSNLDYVAGIVPDLKKVTLVDLSPSLLKVAERRVQNYGWHHVTTELADACSYSPEAGSIDIITFSYSLSMVPDWRQAIRNALQLLKPGGIIGVVDFYVSRPKEQPGVTQHNWLTRTWWPLWFRFDDVHLSPEPIHLLSEMFRAQEKISSRARLPYFPIGRVPYYIFVGSRPQSSDS